MTTIAPPTITTSNPTPTPDFSLHALSTPPVLAGLATVPVVGGTALAYVKFATGPALIPLTTDEGIKVVLLLETVAVATGRERLAGLLADVMVKVPLVREVSDVIAEEVPEKL